MKISDQYPLKIRAEAIEKLLSGVTVTDLAMNVGCCIQTVSNWFTHYRGYIGKEVLTEVRQSIINNYDNKENQ